MHECWLVGLLLGAVLRSQAGQGAGQRARQRTEHRGEQDSLTRARQRIAELETKEKMRACHLSTLNQTLSKAGAVDTAGLSMQDRLKAYEAIFSKIQSELQTLK